MTGMDLKRLRIDAGFDSVADAAAALGIDTDGWYQMESGYRKRTSFKGNANTLYWALTGYKLYCQTQEIESQAHTLPNIPEVAAQSAKD